MSLPSGTRLGPYKIEAPLGAGGMGEVYRARDTRLGREVAIKVLPQAFARDSERLRRFEQEARTIAALNHPNLLAIHDFGEHNGTPYLVSELLDGESLRAALNRGALPQRKALDYAVQIAQGLAAAHEKTFIHRDLKPENIFLTRDGRVKILDFGLAKLGRPGGETSEEATLTAGSPETSPGVVLGTVGYMSPEQVRGDPADHRSDIFAFGSILYEMLRGRRAFKRDTSAETMTAILKEDPPELSDSALRVSPSLDRILHRCLEKSPDLRFQSAKDLAFALEDVSGTSGSATALAAVAAKKRPLPLPAMLGVAAALVIGFMLGAILFRRWSSPTHEVLQFEVNAPQKTVFNLRGLSGPPVISPDGRTLAFVASPEGPAGSRSLWLRSLDSMEARKITGSEEPSYPFWSPDSRNVGFFAAGKLKRYELSSGTLLTVCDVFEGRGGAWWESGFIIFGTRDGPVYKVSAAGGQPVQITTLDKSKNEGSHRWPLLLPDQDHFFYLAQAPEIHAYIASLKSKERRLLENVETNVALAEGRLFYVRNGALLAQRFDLARLEFTGEAAAVAEGIQTDFQFNFAVFHVSGSAMVYQPGGAELGTRLVSVDRSGKEALLTTGESGELQDLALAPGGDRLLGEIRDPSGAVSDIWLYNLARNTKTRLTFDQRSSFPVWSPDGGRVAFERNVSEGHELVIKSASGSGTETVILRTNREFEPTSWSPDARYIIGEVRPPEIWAVPVAGDHKPIVLLPSGHISGTYIFPALSPDGKWLAYGSNESGIKELYVVPFHPESGVAADSQGKWQVSSGGGQEARWSVDGKELYFTNTSFTTLLVAEVRAAGDHFETGRPAPLFNVAPHPTRWNFYAPTRDGRHFYLTLFSQGSAAPLTVTLNWKERLKK